MFPRTQRGCREHVRLCCLEHFQEKRVAWGSDAAGDGAVGYCVAVGVVDADPFCFVFVIEIIFLFVFIYLIA